MRYTFAQPVVDLAVLDKTIRTLNLTGFGGLSCDGTSLFAEFEGDAEIPAEDKAALDATIKAYVYAPSWDKVREDRIPLLDAADICFRRCFDNDMDTAALKVYRQALRDVTKGPDPLKPVWPVKP
jgi:hypothetical protein